jgi:hypothetical protein
MEEDVLHFKHSFCDDETWEVWKADKKYLGSLKCNVGEGWRR